MPINPNGLKAFDVHVHLEARAEGTAAEIQRDPHVREVYLGV